MENRNGIMMWAMSRAISHERFDVVFFPSVYTYVPVIGPARVIVVIHDLIAEDFLQHILSTLLGGVQMWLQVVAARRCANLVMTVSEASRDGIARCFRIPRHQIAVIPEAAYRFFCPLPHENMLAEMLARWKLADGRFLLYVGGISPHKNLQALIDALAELRRRAGSAECKLTLGGDYAGDVFLSDCEKLSKRADALQPGDAVVITGYVDEASLAILHSAAAALVLLSLAEGFGLPVIEAMACGAPVVASARGAVPEALGGAGLLFDPDRSGDLETVSHHLLTDASARDRLRELGLLRASDFSWEPAARQSRAAFRGLIGAPRRGCIGEELPQSGNPT